MAAVFLDAFHRLLDIARIVQRVEHAENIHTVFAGQRDKTLHDIIGIVLVAEQILAAKQHLERSLLADLLDLAQTLPRILAKESHTDIESGPAPAFERIIAGIVDLLSYFENVISAHSCRPKRLVGVTQRGIGYANLSLGVIFHTQVL